MESVFNSMTEYLIVLNEENKIEFLNESLLKELNYSMEQLYRRNFMDLISNKNEFYTSDRIDILSGNNNFKTFKYKLVNSEWKNKKVKFLILESFKEYNEANLEVILDEINYMAWIKDVSGKYVYVNNEYCNKIARNKLDIIGKKDGDLWSLDEVKVIEEEDRRLIETKGRIENEELMRASESRVWFYMIKSVIVDSKGEVKYTYGIGRDITEEKKNKQRWLQLEREKEAENLNYEFFNNISHEFKTPINLVLATAQLMKKNIEKNEEENNSTCKGKEYLNIIENNSYRVLRMVNNLIDMTKIDVGHCEFKLDSVNIVSLVEDVIFDVSSYVKRCGGTIIFDTDIEEKIILCDIEKIERIILNLISNSIKYAKDNCRIIVSIVTRANTVEIIVKDNGIGIERSKLNKIFERFVQGDRSLNRKQEGSGIGLALVKSLVDMHKGKIDIKSRPRKGTEVKIILPDGINGADSNVQLSFPIFKQHNTIEKCCIEFSDIYFA